MHVFKRSMGWGKKNFCWELNRVVHTKYLDKNPLTLDYVGSLIFL
jgi:hypothetical protein